MLVLVISAAAAASPLPPTRALAQARASVRIERPASISRSDWEQLPQSARREVVIRDEDGRMLLLRLIEQQ